MSEPSRQSYYEIALTNRQVLTVFVVLLVSVLTAFLAGAWLGRRAVEGAVETVEAERITAATEPTEEPLERLEFFSREDGTAAGGQTGAPPVDEPQTRAAQVAALDPEPEAELEPEPSSGLVATPPASEPDPTPEVVARAEPPPAEAPAAESSPATPATAGALVVQVFSSNNQVQAQGVVDRLRSGGFPALLSPVEVSGRTMYRVRIGPYSDRQVAEGIAEQVRSEYRLETWITQ